MLKPEIHDPQGEAIAGACQRLGFAEVVSVRQGKRFEVEIADPDTDAIDAADPGEQHGTDSRAATAPAQGAVAHRVAELAAELLANPIIEEFAIHGV
jgi:phosphoribosylformylglycinamidine synthase subunit PurS